MTRSWVTGATTGSAGWRRARPVHGYRRTVHRMDAGAPGHHGTPIGIHPMKRATGWSLRLTLALVALSLGLSGAASGLPGGTGPSSVAAQSPGAGAVYVIPIHGTIRPGAEHFLARSLDDAADAGATTVILDIDTAGGRLDTALAMRDDILDSPVPTVAFVDREAFSAGALLTVAADEIWLTPGAAFGAASPVDAGSGETADARAVAEVRSTFRATAEARDRDPLVAEAMVDPAVTIDGLDTATTLVSLSATQAAGQRGYLDGTATDRADLIVQLGLGAAPVTVTSVSPVEHLVGWLTQPAVATLLILLGVFLIVADALFGGLGHLAVPGAALIGLFFFGHALAGLAGWEDLVLIVVGLGLLAVELLILPGFGVPGIAGLLTLGGGLFLAMSGRGFGDVTLTDEVVRSGWLAVLGVTGAIVGAVLAVVLGPETPGGRAIGPGWLALNATVDGDRGTGALTGLHGRRPGWLVRLSRGDAVLERDEPRPLPTGTRPRPRLAERDEQV